MASDDTRVSSRAGTALQRGLRQRPGVQDFYQHIRPDITCRLSPARNVIAKAPRDSLGCGPQQASLQQLEEGVLNPKKLHVWVFPASTIAHHYVTWMHFLHVISFLWLGKALSESWVAAYPGKMAQGGQWRYYFSIWSLASAYPGIHHVPHIPILGSLDSWLAPSHSRWLSWVVLPRLPGHNCYTCSLNGKIWRKTIKTSLHGSCAHPTSLW